MPYRHKPENFWTPVYRSHVKAWKTDKSQSGIYDMNYRKLTAADQLLLANGFNLNGSPKGEKSQSLRAVINTPMGNRR